ncbi:MAG TPA: UPF0158 family protein [Fimbriimonadaceae bacterium]|nr:UPF0158 family protein [Fimbriimonadaceae bacterium]
MITIDLSELQCAMNDHSGVGEYFLDLETGEVIPKIDDFWGEEEGGEEEDPDKAAMEENPERFLLIDSLPSSQSFAIMEHFVWQLPEAEAKYKLGLALTKRKPFRTFKDALFEFPALREMWFDFELEEFARIAREWLSDNGVEAELRFPKPRSA